MSDKKTFKGLIGAGVVSAIAASLCCITPVLALVAGSTGMASTFAWLEPARPYFIGATVLVLGFAWWQKIKPKKEDADCCEVDEKPSFWQSKKFLGIITVFAALMLTFPYYAHLFYPSTNNNTTIVESENVKEVEFQIEGMTCTGCEQHIIHAVNDVEGVVEVIASYEKGNATVKFDETKTTASELEKAINSTGYEVTETDTKSL